MVTVVLFGMISLFRLDREFMPALEFPQLVVLTGYANASSQEMENFDRWASRLWRTKLCKWGWREFWRLSLRVPSWECPTGSDLDGGATTLSGNLTGW
jgi:hypothetical protein